jgi:DNA-binding NarL/FixJ family response regulator
VTENAQPIRVVLADDHQVVRHGIRGFLVESGDIEVIAEAEDGKQATELIAQHQPDVAVLDIQMPERSGIDVIRWIREQDLPVGVLILTAYDDDPYLVAAIEEGTNGYILKTADAEEIVRAVHDVYEGKSVLGAELTGKMMRVIARSSDSHTLTDELTERELDVLCEAARGLTNKAIGYKLGISDRTVQGHLRNIYEKLQVSNRTEAVMKGVQLGLLEAPD